MRHLVEAGSNCQNEDIILPRLDLHTVGIADAEPFFGDLGHFFAALANAVLVVENIAFYLEVGSTPDLDRPAIAQGIAFVEAFSTASAVAHRWLCIIAGFLALLLGAFLFVRPSGILSVVWLIGAFSIVYGALLLISVMFPGKAGQAS